MLYYLVAFCAIAGAYAQTMPNGSCPTFKANSVNAKLMVGKWYDWGRSSNNALNGQRCGYENWNQPSNGVSKLVQSAYSPFIGGYSRIVSDIKFYNGNQYTIGFEVPNVGTISVNHAILDTDYNRYVIYYQCLNLGSTYSISLWIKTRDQYPGSKVENQVYNALNKFGLSYVPLIHTSQQNC
ncbi:GSCOCG00008047001-RA-CDS [Cotesia congregata]|nr:GSCOCG00008047001-RA-CDS [Cotesia congregata]